MGCRLFPMKSMMPLAFAFQSLLFERMTAPE
jgi:hypothetical protein